MVFSSTSIACVRARARRSYGVGSDTAPMYSHAWTSRPHSSFLLGPEHDKSVAHADPAPTVAVANRSLNLPDRCVMRRKVEDVQRRPACLGARVGAPDVLAPWIFPPSRSVGAHEVGPK